jgi:hypothetical protein
MTESFQLYLKQTLQLGARKVASVKRTIARMMSMKTGQTAQLFLVTSLIGSEKD